MDKAKQEKQQLSKIYWFMFSVLLIFLLLLLRYPFHFLSEAWLNPFLYSAIGIVSFVMLGIIVYQYGLRQKIIPIVLICAVIAFWMAYLSPTHNLLEKHPIYGDCYPLPSNVYVPWLYISCNYYDNCMAYELAYITNRRKSFGVAVTYRFETSCDYSHPRNWNYIT